MNLITNIDKITTRPGDIWTLGDHTLLCDDSMYMENINKIINDKVDMVITDPPYAIYGSSSGNQDNIVDGTFTIPFFEKVLSNIREVTKEFGHIYVTCDYRTYPYIVEAAKLPKLPLKNCIVWQKNKAGGLGSNYTMSYELIAFFHNEPIDNIMRMQGKRPGRRLIRGRTNIWYYPKKCRHLKDKLHNAEKPVDLMEYAITNSTDEGETVLDMFGGSGTTLIACENTGRKCYMIEKDKYLCDLIVKRYIATAKELGNEIKVLRNGKRFEWKHLGQ